MVSRPSPDSPDFRSWIMSRIQSRNTTPELVVRRLLFSMGYRYRLHDNRLPGVPDVVFRGKRKIIWIHGCFWHGHDCRKGQSIPKTNTQFWTNKRRRTIERDAQNLESLIAMDWQALIIWECEVRRLDLRDRLKKFLD
ncbi:MAG TPA: very short patch repair endonuclease [Candidatus Cloacimonadota bacterium]|nr:very short patch repair endonuclease [Candidatus Cloacimonadota bacterium]